MSLSQDRWRRVEALFQEALGRAPEERAAWLSGACGGDVELQGEVADLLAADSQGGEVLEEVVRGGLEEVQREPPSWLVGRRLGPYRVERLIGRGGTSTVFLAERSDGSFEKQVAVKLLRAGMASPDLRRRFEVERRILAALDHPHIARLLDAGTTEEGLSYFVMEYVEGEPVDRFCAARELSVGQRLELFRTVCSAVQHAHRNLVIHRDLKPSNILVDVEGRPKLLDFGIAKLLASSGTLAAEEPTRTTARLLTPSYASPEQILGEPLSTATDVFSLGVLLYELLTGRHPYRGGSRTPGELEHRICEADPEKPSVAATSPQLRRRLAGDLDNIVLTAMRREPDRRYGAAEQLSDDLRSHLAGLPVKARKPTWRYRGAKFVRRQRLGLAVAAAVAALIVSFALTAFEQHRRTVDERDRAELSRSFLVDLFELSEPGRTGGASITAREILDRGAEQIRAMEGQPEMQAELMATVGRVYLKMELFDRAGPLLEQALGLRRRALGDHHPDVAVSLQDLADVLLLEGGAYERAEDLCLEALAIRRRVNGEAHPDVAVSLNCLAEIHHDQGDYEAAEKLYRRVLDMRRRLLGAEHVDLAASLNGLALLYHDWGDLESAEPLYRQALAMRRRLLRPEHPQLATSLNNLAALLHKKGDLKAAEDLFREAVGMQRRLLGDRNPSLAGSLQNLALLISDRGDHSAAESLLREVVEIQSEYLAEDHPARATTGYNLGRVIEKKGDSRQAAALYRQAIAAYRHTLPADHPWLAFPLLSLGKLLVGSGDAAAAEPLLRESLAIRRRALPAGQWRTGEAESALGACLAALGHHGEAEPLLLSGYRTIRAERGDEDEWTRGARARLDRFREARHR